MNVDPERASRRATRSGARRGGDRRGAADGAWSVVEVADSGRGHLRRELRRTSSIRSSPPRTTGSGLGLFIAHRIVTEHGGTIDVRSRGRTGGTVFSIRLPAIAARQRDVGTG